MTLAPFKLERYYALYEFKARIMLSSSDCESLSMTELLSMAPPDSLNLWNNLKLGYTETQGNPLLRAEAARIYEHISPDNLLISAPEELIYITMQTLLQPGDRVVVLAPAYQSLYEVAASIGCHVFYWNLHPTTQGWEADIDELKRLLTPPTRLLVMNIPNNPTGFLPSREDLETIVNLARESGIILFSDEMYRLLEREPSFRLPAVCDLYENGISLSGLSKSMALPGLRIGWLASQNTKFLEKWMGFKDYTTICNSAPSEVLGLIALQNRPNIVDRNLRIIGENIKIAQNVFTEYLHQFDWIPPRAGSIAFPRWKGKGSVEDFCRNVLDRYSVMIVPGSMFDYPGGHFRLGLGRKNFHEGMDAVVDYLKE
ncbi:aminotransferase class I/II-fold pyridoxal phosphate-dependent enzyme [Leptolinea tardivitalis]|uniref:Aminotransferase n=1 Tax=Leptolinea tardivitalis TaxID=229920 RepID=A0A0P6X6V9_9CHLR|nr:aminotransferase class I/II-fold pyridoxal phosphate-dependent enzyme [Leptolinea tardivitalis]KPL75107.1 hypothetical protein ADM99_00350 [Leptolinea tardivitalis]GAP20416.1 aspartate/tyrosine/aromatic aminotransferase [Leptolinea tardivitalis]